jgi:anti-sigma factor RsiW
MTQEQPQVGAAHADYADWDAAYVLGALSSAERRDFERHLHSCPRCTQAVSELAGMPGLLARVDPDDVAALLAVDSAIAPTTRAVDAGATAPTDATPIDSGWVGSTGTTGATTAGGDGDLEPPIDLLARIDKARTAETDRLRSRRFRRRAAVLVAAAIIVAGAIVVPIVLTRGEQPTVAAELVQTSRNPLSADVQLYGEPWGTRITMTCVYATDGGWAVKQPPGAWTYALYVVDHQGKQSQVSSWTATRGSTVHATGSTNVDVSDIDSVQVRSVDTGAVLLAADIGVK